MTLTDTQSILLSAASQRDDLLVAIHDRLKGGAARKVAEGLIARGLVEETTVPRSSPFWREENGEPIGLRITRAGLTAIGLDEEVGAPTELPSEASSGQPQSAPDTQGEALTAEAPSALQMISEPYAAPAQPRAGSKQGQLITMLSRDEGASIAEIATAFGWLPHTTRAALTGLRHKCYELARENNGERGSVYRITAVPITAPAATDAVQAEAA